MPSNVYGCPTVCGQARGFETGSLSQKASVLQPLAKAGYAEPARGGFRTGWAAVAGLEHR